MRVAEWASDVSNELGAAVVKINGALATGVAVDARGISTTLPDPTILTYFASKLKRGLPDELAIHYELETDGLFIYYDLLQPIFKFSDHYVRELATKVAH